MLSSEWPLLSGKGKYKTENAHTGSHKSQPPAKNLINHLQYRKTFVK